MFEIDGLSKFYTLRLKTELRVDLQNVVVRKLIIIIYNQKPIDCNNSKAVTERHCYSATYAALENARTW